MIQTPTGRRPGLRRLALLTVGAAVALSFAAPITALAQGPTFTCRASALRIDTFGPLDPLTQQPIEPFVANRDRSQCKNDKAALVDEALPGGLGEVALLFARTQRNGGSTARAGVVDATINAPAAIGPVAVEVLTSRATASCNRKTGVETFTGSSRIAAVTVGGQTIEPVPGESQTVTLVEGARILEVSFAQQTQTAEQITQRALVVQAFDPITGGLLAEVVVAEAIADVHGCEPPCNSGRGNGSEPVPPGECDPGRSLKNQGGD